MYFGAHVSIQPSLDKAPWNAHRLGCECFQYFTQSPRGGPRKIPAPEKVTGFLENLKKYKIKASYAHAPYFINLASRSNAIFYGSIAALRKDLEIASLLGSEGLVVHLGSAKDWEKADNDRKGIEKIPLGARKRVKEGLEKILKGFQGKAQLILEIAAGSGNIIGSDIEQLAFFIKEVTAVGGICFDTAHAFESGIAINDKKILEETLKEIGKTIGFEKLKLIHANDSKTKLGSKSDRHEHLGKGEIGLAPFRFLVQDPRLKSVNMIVETPTEAGMKKDLTTLKKMRKEAGK